MKKVLKYVTHAQGVCLSSSVIFSKVSDAFCFPFLVNIMVVVSTRLIPAKIMCGLTGGATGTIEQGRGDTRRPWWHSSTMDNSILNFLSKLSQVFFYFILQADFCFYSVFTLF